MKKRSFSILLALVLAVGLVLSAAAAGCPCNIEYRLGGKGVTADKTTAAVASDTKPGASTIPDVQGLSGWVFVGWSSTDPEKGQATMVKPEDVRVTGDTVYYAVYEPFHKHYVIGYPNGEFGPDDLITRGSVATIIARAGFEGVPGAESFEEGTIYANDAGLVDVAGHWAESAISYCAKHGVFNGYGGGLFMPDQPITREEYVAAVVRLAQVTDRLPESDKTAVEDFLDIDDAMEWAVADIRTAQAAGWVSGYTGGEYEGMFLPGNNIRRDEAVKIFNAYLHRGVDAAGLEGLTEYVHSGVASNVTENGTTEYMTWPDVPKDHWAYYEIIEAANDHSYDESKTSLPEKWSKCWIDQRWRYHDDATDTGPLGGTGAGVDITDPNP